jgi:CHAD domain-containing protein
MRMASVHITAELRKLDARIEATSARVLASADEDAVHDFRVAVRRLRVLLQLARPLYGRFLADAVRREFTALQRATGALRDEEAFDATLRKVTIEDARLSGWRGERAARAHHLQQTVIERLKSEDLSRARQMLQALIVLPVKPSRDAPLSEFARRKVDKARRAMEAKEREATPDAEPLHDLRIACKKLRYTIDLLEAGLSEDERTLREPAMLLQRELGDVHDLDVAVGLVTASSLPKRLRKDVVRDLTTRRDDILARILDGRVLSNGASGSSGKLNKIFDGLRRLAVRKSPFRA